MTQDKQAAGRTPQIVAGLFLWLVMAALVWFTRGLPLLDEGAPGPRFMPLMIAVCLAILNVLYFADIFFSKSAKALAMPPLAELAGPVAYVLLGLFLILFWERLGVVATVLLVTVVELKFLERCSWLRSVVVGLVISLATWTVFQFLLGVPLPAGVLAWLLVR
jgi:putative tricarboxylic transport membrane protein